MNHTVDPTSLGRSRRLVGGSLIAAPLLMVASAAALAADIGVPPEAWNNGSWVEGLFGAFGLVAFIPVYLSLAHRLSSHLPRLAGTLRVSGLVGAAAGITWESLRIFCWALAEVGQSPEEAERFVEEQLRYTWPLAVSVLFPVTSMVLGVALVGRGLTRSQGLGLAGGGSAFLAANALGIVPRLSLPLSGICWAVALVPLGIEVLRHREDTVEAPPASPVEAIVGSD